MRPVAPPAIAEPTRSTTNDASIATDFVRPPASSYRPPELTVRVEPVYSRFAREARLQGSVQISAIIGKNGVPHSLTRLSGNALLGEMAMSAMRKWLYRPAFLNGQPTEAQTIVTINFQLQ
jgi:TonB family protein